MVFHSNDQNGTTCFILSAKTIFSRGVNFTDNLLFFGDEVGPVFFKPFDPVSPHFDDLFLLKLAGYRESGDGVDIGIEILLRGEMAELAPEDIEEILLVGLDLCEFAIGNEEGIGCDFHGDIVLMSNIWSELKVSVLGLKGYAILK